MQTFGWRPVAAASKPDYERLQSEHPILADIACFQSSHINHLTPRTLDIQAAQECMKNEGMTIKERIEGPPKRVCPILLRQTSFLALEEPIRFPRDDQTSMVAGVHKARFGEIEERGAAVTQKGRLLYEHLLQKAIDEVAQLPQGHSAVDEDNVLSRVFEQYPDTWDELRREKLVYFEFRCSPNKDPRHVSLKASLNELLSHKVVEAVPLTYEDFLPLSAAGIFQSNLQSGSKKASSIALGATYADQKGYEQALGVNVADMDRWHADAERDSLRACAHGLGLPMEAFIKQVNPTCGWSEYNS